MEYIRKQFYTLKERILEPRKFMQVLAGGEADMSGFTEAEMAVINEVCGKLRDMTSRAVSKLSHEETAWKEHVGKPETIPFSEAFKLVGV